MYLPNIIKVVYYFNSGKRKWAFVTKIDANNIFKEIVKTTLILSVQVGIRGTLNEKRKK